ncbi:MAG TPA: hypothetical protein VNI77_08955 [Nitrososphaera sp.]|nr:hypothetical protein [Nitrososphaera sp.]
MTEYRFTDGNLIILYAIHRSKTSNGSDDLPDYIKERVKLGLETYHRVIKSRPDRHKTMVIVVGEQSSAEKVKQALVEGGVNPDIIAIDSESKNMAQTVGTVVDMIKSKPNPPFIYFVGSVWLQDIFNSTVISKLKGYRMQFYGALDHRPVDEVEKEKALDAPKKGMEYYKHQAKNKAVDMLLNIIFPD